MPSAAEALALVGLLLTAPEGDAGVREAGGVTETGGWEGERALGGSARLFLFQALEGGTGFDDAEQAAVRVTFEQGLVARDRERSVSSVRFEVHGVLSGAAPVAARARGGVSGSGVVGGRSGHRRLDLETELTGSDPGDDVRLVAELDRVNVRFEHHRFRLTVGRQAITWGVSYFWPVLDLFGPFAPSAVDRDYKTGIDAVRWSVPVGDFSEVEVVAAAQSRDAVSLADGDDDDWSYGALGRFHLGGTDVGLLAGEFYRDTVAGAFVTGDAGGFGLRGELLYTDVGEDQLGLPGEDASSFWRATVGFDRLLSARASLSAELSWNGWGAENPAEYGGLALSDRVRRGDVTSLGREYAGVSAAFQLSPLVTVAASLLVNGGDESALLQPSLVWSISNNASVLGGAFVGFGDGMDAEGLPGSEYGPVPTTVWGAVRTFF